MYPEPFLGSDFYIGLVVIIVLIISIGAIIIGIVSPPTSDRPKPAPVKARNLPAQSTTPVRFRAEPERIQARPVSVVLLDLETGEICS
jgi:hypothetical protein